MPFLEEDNVLRRWDYFVEWSSDDNVDIGQTDVALLTCPSKSEYTQGDLNYVINAGNGSVALIDEYDGADMSGKFPTEVQMHSHNMIPIDWDENGQVWDKVDGSTTRDTGVSWVHLGSKNFSFRIDRIRDGCSHTLLFGENYRTGWGETRAIVRHNWSNPSVLTCAFVYPVNTDDTKASNFSDPPRPNGISGLPNDDESLSVAPFLSSQHPSLVNVVMVDGSIRTIADDMDRVVYKAWMTPNGAGGRIVGIQSESAVSHQLD